MNIALEKGPALGQDQSIHISVDRSIYPRPGIDDRTGPENLEVERRKKTGSKVAI